MKQKNSFSLSSFLLFGICTVIILFPLTYVRFRVFDLPLNVIEAFVVVLSLILLTQRLKDKKEISFPYLWPCLLILLGLSLSAVLLSDLVTAMGIIKGWFVIPMLFGFIMTQTVNTVSLRYIIFALAINVMIVSFYTLLQYYGLIPLLPHQLIGGDLNQYVEQGRALAYFESPNFIAMYLIPPTIFLALIWKEKLLRLLPFLVLPLSAVYLSRSRAGIVAMLIVLSLIGLSTLYRKSRWATSIGAIVSVAIIAFYLATHVTFSGADTLRLGIWKVAINLVTAHPLVGIGPGQFLEAFTASEILDDNLYRNTLQYALHPHNIFLNFWLSGGLLAIGAFLWLLYQLLFLPYSPKVPTYRIAARWAIAAILIHGLFDSTYFKGDLALMFWLFASIIAVSGISEAVSGHENRHENLATAQ